jgi:hypothetical protein
MGNSQSSCCDEIFTTTPTIFYELTSNTYNIRKKQAGPTCPKYAFLIDFNQEITSKLNQKSYIFIVKCGYLFD